VKTIIAKLKQGAKAAAMSAYSHHWLPASVTQWIIQTGGLCHE
jgi:hypothetical protein